MCSEPVTLGGGIMIEKVSARLALAPALKAPALSQSAAIRASASALSSVWKVERQERPIGELELTEPARDAHMP